ncbi:MAG: hypothetical protein M3Y85_07415, partial [Bacteroidota bacterium]|nr:hypothetical protein [Bacteroidota bacterium]
MKQIAIAFCTATFLFACNAEDKKADETKNGETKVASSTTTNGTTKTDEWIPVDSATAMKKMMEAGTPGPQQAMLAKYDGAWTAET